MNTTDSKVGLSIRLDRIAQLTEEQDRRIRAALRHRIAGDALVITASEHRSQLRN